MSSTFLIIFTAILFCHHQAIGLMMAARGPNIYLASCITHSCYQCPVRYLHAAVLYPNEPPNNNYDVDKVPVWFQDTNNWAGQNRTVSFDGADIFEYKISSMANRAATGETTGSGSLNGKPFTCVKQAGQTLWFPEERDNINCMPDHWCKPE